MCRSSSCRAHARAATGRKIGPAESPLCNIETFHHPNGTDFNMTTEFEPAPPVVPARIAA